MKYIIVLSMLFTTSVFADTNCKVESTASKVEETTEIKTDVPNHLKGAQIIVRLADGRESVVPAEKFKVVPRLQQYLVTKVSSSTVKSCTNLDHNRNRISLLGGEAPTGHLDRDGNADKTTVESERGLVGGAQYQRLLTDKLSVGIQGQTNKSGMVLIGVDF